VIDRFSRAVALLGLLAASCGGGGGGGSGGSSDPPALVTGVIGPAGGVVAVTNAASPHFGTGIEFPPGALGVPTVIAIYAFDPDPDAPSFVPSYEIRPTALILTGPLPTVTVRISEAYLAQMDQLPEDRVALFAKDEGAEVLRYVPSVPVNTVAHTISADVDRLGKFFAGHAFIFRLLWQAPRLIDPSVPTPSQNIFGTEILVAGGDSLVLLGQGALDGPGGFWQSDATRNVVFLHGVFGSPVDFTAAGDIVAGLEQEFANVVLAQYPSVRSIADSANALYDAIRPGLDGAAPGFGFHVVGYSMGGLVARSLVEQAHADPMRPGFQTGDPPLDTVVESVVLLATPNQGTQFGDDILLVRFADLPPADLPFFQGALDLSLASPFTTDLNATFGPPAAAYYSLAGQLPGEDGDGVVTVASAQDEPVPVTATELLSGAEFGHTALAFEAIAIGVVVQIVAWIG